MVARMEAAEARMARAGVAESGLIGVAMDDNYEGMKHANRVKLILAMLILSIHDVVSHRLPYAALTSSMDELALMLRDAC